MIILLKTRHYTKTFFPRISQEDIHFFFKNNRNTKIKGYFHSETQINLKSTNEKKIIPRLFVEFLEGIGSYQINGSGWYLKDVIQLDIHKVYYYSLKGSSFIPLADIIKRKFAVVNSDNKDDKNASNGVF